MKQYLSINDVGDLDEAIIACRKIKKNPHKWSDLGKNKTLGMLFFNPSLRTRISTLKAAQNLGLNVLPIDFKDGAWSLEFEQGVKMNDDKAEHIKEAAAVIGQYCDFIAIRAFAGLKDADEDKREPIFSAFSRFTQKPLINLESARQHPLQTLADILTIEEYKSVKKPKVVLSWAPHPHALPHAVANSFVEGMRKCDYEFIITHPPGYELDETITAEIPICYDQNQALRDADFVYVKNWSSVKSYGQVLNQDESWMLTNEKLKLTNQAKVLHCLPVRRNVVIADDVLDGAQSIVIPQAENRLYAIQYVLMRLLGANIDKSQISPKVIDHRHYDYLNSLLTGR
ncbi:MAG: acetylornithine carbamoyltransferase [Francisellaceae bacterium]